MSLVRPVDCHLAGGYLSGSDCSPRLVAVSPVVIFLAVTGAPLRCRGRRIVPACHDTDRCAAPYVSRRVSGPKTRFLSRDTDRCADSYVSRMVSGPKMRFSCRDTDRIGKWSVSWLAGLFRLHSAAMPFAQAFVACISRRCLSPKCARRTGHRQRGIRFCCAHSP